MNAKLSCLGLLTAGVLLIGGSAVNASGYTFFDLGTLGGTYSHGFAINNSGQVTGDHISSQSGCLA